MIDADAMIECRHWGNDLWKARLYDRHGRPQPLPLWQIDGEGMRPNPRDLADPVNLAASILAAIAGAAVACRLAPYFAAEWLLDQPRRRLTLTRADVLLWIGRCENEFGL